MRFLENTTHKKSLKFVKQSDDEERFQLSITLNTNHDLNKSVLNEIERLVDNLFLSDYMKEEQYKQMHKQKQDEEKRLKKEQLLKEKGQLKRQTGMRLLSQM